LSNPISQGLSQRVIVLKQALIDSKDSSNTFLQLSDGYALLVYESAVLVGLPSQVCCFLASGREDIFGLIDNVAFARLPMIVVSPAL